MSDLIKVGVQYDAGNLPAGVKQASKAVDAFGKEARDAGRDLDRLSVEGEKAKDTIHGVTSEADRSSRSFDRMDASIARGTSALSSRMATLQTTQRIALRGSQAIVNQWTVLGAGVAAAANQVSSAGLDKTLNRIRLTADATREQANGLREDLFRLGNKTGQSVDDLAAGFDNLIQSGSSWTAAREQIEATGIAMAVGGANAQDLTNALGVAATAFDLDMEKPGLALEILDKMRVAGKLGSAEMEMLSGIFARVGVNASRAGMSMDQSLAFIEALSQVEKNPERLATLADSTLRLFTNLSYLKTATKATGIKFFDVDGNRRDARAILGDMRTQFRKLQTDKARAAWIQKAFGQTDLDTQKGAATLLGGDMLEKISEFSSKISQASGTLNKQLPDAVDNANDQVGRLKNSLRKAGDEFARPINNVIKDVSHWSADSPTAAKGALVAGGGIAAAAGGIVLAGKFAEAIREIRGLFGKKGSGAAGALEGVAGGPDGVRVFVTNWGGMGGTLGGGLSSGTAAAESAAAQSATRSGLMQRLFPTFSRWGASAAGWAKGLGATAASKAQQFGVWGQGKGYAVERMLGRTAAGRWAMNTGSNLLERSTGLWRNMTWGSGTLATLLRIGNPVLRGSILASAIGIPLEYLSNGVSMRSTAAGLGGAIGGTLGWLGGAGLGAATTWGAASVPLAMAGSAGGGWAGREGTLAVYDFIAGLLESQNKASAAASNAGREYAPTLNIGVNFDALGRPTTVVDGPGASYARIQSQPLGSQWRPGFPGF